MNYGRAPLTDRFRALRHSTSGRRTTEGRWRAKQTHLQWTLRPNSSLVPSEIPGPIRQLRSSVFLSMPTRLPC